MRVLATLMALAICVCGEAGETSITTQSKYGSWRFPRYYNETIPFSGGVIQPTLSAQTFTGFNDTSVWELITSATGDYYANRGFYYRRSLNNSSDFRDFEIHATEYTGSTLGSESLIYGYTGATNSYTVYDASYFIM